MKILQVIPYFSPKFGGDVKVCTNFSKELVQRKHEVTIITTDFGFDSQYADIIRSKGVRVIVLPCVANFRLLLFSPSLKHWLEENLVGFDIIHLHSYRAYQNVVIHKYAMKLGIPYILQAHGSILPFFEKQNLKKLYDFVWGSRILKDASKLIALTDTESEQYQRMGIPINKIEIIPNCVDLFQFSKLPQKGAFRTKYCISLEDKIILFLGRIHKIKGIDLLITAYSELQKEMPNARLVIVGPDDNYLSVIQKQIEKLKFTKHSPLFTGPLYEEEKIAAYVDSDVYVLPSRYETFPMAILEAFATETPVITTNNCGIADAIRSNQAGCVINFNSGELMEAIHTLMLNMELRKKYIKNGKNLLWDKYSSNKVNLKLIQLYENVILEEKCYETA